MLYAKTFQSLAHSSSSPCRYHFINYAVGVFADCVLLLVLVFFALLRYHVKRVHQHVAHLSVEKGDLDGPVVCFNCAIAEPKCVPIFSSKTSLSLALLCIIFGLGTFSCVIREMDIVFISFCFSSYIIPQPQPQLLKLNNQINEITVTVLQLIQLLLWLRDNLFQKLFYVSIPTGSELRHQVLPLALLPLPEIGA